MVHNVWIIIVYYREVEEITFTEKTWHLMKKKKRTIISWQLRCGPPFIRLVPRSRLIEPFFPLPLMCSGRGAHLYVYPCLFVNKGPASCSESDIRNQYLCSSFIMDVFHLYLFPALVCNSLYALRIMIMINWLFWSEFCWFTFHTFSCCRHKPTNIIRSWITKVGKLKTKVRHFHSYLSFFTCQFPLWSLYSHTPTCCYQHTGSSHYKCKQKIAWNY